MGRSSLKIGWFLSYATSPSSELSQPLAEDSKVVLPCGSSQSARDLTALPVRALGRLLTLTVL